MQSEVYTDCILGAKQFDFFPIFLRAPPLINIIEAILILRNDMPPSPHTIMLWNFFLSNFFGQNYNMGLRRKALIH